MEEQLQKSDSQSRFAEAQIAKQKIEHLRKVEKDKALFLSRLFKEITAAIKSAKKKELTATFRLNLTSDLPWEKIKLHGVSILELFPEATFYDYTKSPERMTAFLAGEMPKNYHLTFSRSETNGAIAESILKSGGNVAMVFRKSLPAQYLGADVINGDETDLRFLDGAGKIIGLVEKGKAKKDESGFVIEA